MRAGVYTRISLDRYGDGSAVARQLQDARVLAKQRGWQLVQEYQDNDISAAGKRHRPAFEQLLADIKSGKLDAVIAWNFDRLARNRTDEVRFIEACQKAETTVSLVRGSDLDMSTPAGRLVADMMASTARHEIEVKSDRQQRANLQRAEAGAPHAARRAFGYASNGIDLVESEAALLRDAYSMVLAGASTRAVARKFNDAGATTTMGGQWLGNTARRTMLNPRYAGIRDYKGQRYPATWPAIVSEDVWQAARAVLTDPNRSTVQDRSIKFLLSSIAHCGRCGAKVGTSRTAKGRRVYKCGAQGDLTRDAERIDAYVEAVIISRLSQPDAADLLKPAQPDVDVAKLRMEVNAQRVKLHEAAQLFADDAIQAGQLATITKTAEARIQSLESEIAAATRRSPLVSLVGADDVAEAWAGLDVIVQRAILKLLFERVTLEGVRRGQRAFEPESVTLEWRQ